MLELGILAEKDRRVAGEERQVAEKSPQSEDRGYKMRLQLGMDNDLAVFAHADAFGADAGHVFESEMDDTALARGHGI